MPHTPLIDILAQELKAHCDREADFFEMFDEQRSHRSVDLLVRANGARVESALHDRNIAEDPFKMWEAVRQAEVMRFQLLRRQSRVRVQIPRQSARPKKSKQQARAMRPARAADLTVRFMRVQIRPGRHQAGKEPIDIWVIHAREENPPPNTEAVEWFLLTTIKLDSPEDAEKCLRMRFQLLRHWYCLRWRIEDWHRRRKS